MSTRGMIFLNMPILMKGNSHRLSKICVETSPRDLRFLGLYDGFLGGI